MSHLFPTQRTQIKTIFGRIIPRIRINNAYLFVAPSVLVMTIFMVYPIIQALWMSLHDWSFVSPERPFIAFDNYAELLQDPRALNSLRVTTIYTFISVPAQIGLGLLLALALNQPIRGVKLFRSIYFFPVISSFAVMSIVWKFLNDANIGLISQWLVKLGLPQINWLQSITWALPAVIFTGVWKNIGFVMVILLAGLQGIPEEYYEAARIDGASRWSCFRHITVPSLRQALIFVIVITVIASLQAFDQVYIMTRGGPLFTTETIVSYVYHQAFRLFRMGYASALSWILFLIIMAISVIQLKFFRYHEID